VFVTLEGLDGVGKTTQARLLAGRLRDAGREVVECREPGGTPLGEELRTRVLHGAAIDARSEALLFAAARAELVARVVRPALERGAWVVCDRFLDSSVAYQGGGRGLGLADVRAVSVFATGGLVPHRTLLLVGPRRLDDERDRIEAEGDRFAAVVADAFSALAEAEPERVRRVDASGSEDEVAGRVWEAVGA
jgi:dTMP kinase